ncbi:C39 family peptidase [Vagococcus fluvialis]|uniref:C39 family peptidase n=1 Tax=Vagococcus fluvialis TaxID=2738 RepID=UPI001D0BB2B8|nr:C39 family peptidase [Vagococcus fluvialis]UDM80855.1 C39 family peptidase [Vagococcus fluvialis]
MKKKFPELLLVLSTLAIISLFFTVYLTRFVTNQRVEAAKIVEAERKKEEQAAQKLAKRTYQEKMNDKINNKEFDNRMSVPLIIQTEEPWREVFYGVPNEEPLQNTIAINGCAIVSLAMVSSYLEEEFQSPLDILDWSGNAYFEKETGTGWHIFGEFAKEKKYQYEDLVDQKELVKMHLKKSHPVIVSVKPGYFTEVGHIMVLTGYDETNNTFWINNPSDTKKKGHAEQAFSEDILTEEALRYWAIY